MLLVDGANVVGARPDGWWRDRPGAAARLVAELRDAVAAGRLGAPVTVVLEGAARRGEPEGEARRGEPEGEAGGVRVVHAPGSGDDALAALCAPGVELVTADRGLRARAEAAGATTSGPSALLGRLRR